MTTKEIAELAGVSTDTVIRKAKELFPSKYEHGKKAIFTQKEAIQTVGELRKKGFIELPQNAPVLPQNAEVAGINKPFSSSQLEQMAAVVAMVMSNLDKRVQTIESRIETRQALLPAPQVSPRTHVTQIVRAYAVAVDREVREVYTDLYREFGYRTNTSPALCAKNRGMPTMDYIEAEGMIETLEAVALDYLK